MSEPNQVVLREFVTQAISAHSDGLKQGMIIGAIIGALAGALLAVGVIFLLRWMLG